MSICIEKLTSVKEQKTQPHRIAHVTNSGSRSFEMCMLCIPTLLVQLDAVFYVH